MGLFPEIPIIPVFPEIPENSPKRQRLLTTLFRLQFSLVLQIIKADIERCISTPLADIGSLNGYANAG